MHSWRSLETRINGVLYQRRMRSDLITPIGSPHVCNLTPMIFQIDAIEAVPYLHIEALQHRVLASADPRK
jgi:hypothetical protein